MPPALNYTYLVTSFTETRWFGYEWIIAIAIIIITMAVITRDINRWKTLALPVTVLWNIIGIEIHILMFFAVGILFAIDIISLQLLGHTLESTFKFAKEVERIDPWAIAKRRKQIEEQAEIKEEKGFWARQQEKIQRRALVKKLSPKYIEPRDRQEPPDLKFYNWQRWRDYIRRMEQKGEK